MANKYRGEINANFNGKDYTLCLTLGALAQLEDVFQADDMISVAQRFSSGRISASDCIKIIGIGLRAAGHKVSDETVASFQCQNGAGGYVQVVAALLEATFGAQPKPHNMDQNLDKDSLPKETAKQLKKNTAPL